MKIFEVIAGYTENHKYKYCVKAENINKAKTIMRMYFNLFTIYSIKEIEGIEESTTPFYFEEMLDEQN